MELEPAFAQIFLQGMMKNSPGMVFAADAGGRLAAFSGSGEAVLGYGRGELSGKKATDIAEDPGGFSRLLEDCRSQGKVVGREIVLRHKDGGSIPAELTLFELRGPGGEAFGIGGVFLEKENQEALQEKLIRIDRMAEIGRTAADAAHEINNPLAIISQISGWVGTVVADAEGLIQEDREELETAVKRISEQIERCKRLTRQLLSFARETAPSRALCDFREILERAVGFLGPELKHKRIDVAFDFGDLDDVTVYSDPGLLEQVFVNLVANAIYAVKEKQTGGRITLKTLKSGSDLLVEVADTGPGIPEEVRDKIFDIFFTTKPSGKGTGLGIPICLNILKKLGGDMAVDSEVGVGTTFTVRLPMA
ncbi:MAG: PAS domain S-box protein [Deltaproteobacteria bacterium]|nr:PAS domain S-box protein [Deltaproteobacteria bacterium]